jgi:alpha,alpha-trehalase
VAESVRDDWALLEVLREGAAYAGFCPDAETVRSAATDFHMGRPLRFGDIPSGNCGDPIYRLTTDFYASDHAQRAAGTRSGRFGLYGELAMDFAALDLHVLLHQMARDIDALSERVGLAPPTGPEDLAARRAFLAGFFARPSGGFGDRFIAPLRPGFVPLFTYPHGLELTVLWADILADRTALRGFLQTLARRTPEGPGFLTAPNMPRFGVPASLSATNEPWDGPLGWAPIQHYAAEGLIGVGALTTARTVMRQWLAAVDTFFAVAGETLPVYDVVDPGRDPRPALDAQTLAAGEAWSNATYMIFVNALAELR